MPVPAAGGVSRKTTTLRPRLFSVGGSAMGMSGLLVAVVIGLEGLDQIGLLRTRRGDPIGLVATLVAAVDLRSQVGNVEGLVALVLGGEVAPLLLLLAKGLSEVRV